MKHNEGFNAATDVYGDLAADGVIDPVKVTRSALANAASIAAIARTQRKLSALHAQLSLPAVRTRLLFKSRMESGEVFQKMTD